YCCNGLDFPFAEWLQTFQLSGASKLDFNHLFHLFYGFYDLHILRQSNELLILSIGLDEI
ncbi:MAG: hypothetical protein ACQESG_07810, partial [Nanobdellota archaeon]